MKKKLLLFVALLLTTTSIFASPISHGDAKKKALSFIKDRRHGMRFASQSFKGLQLTNATLAKNTDAYYVFNVGDNAGYIIVSADDRAEAILGYSDHGTFSADAIPTNMQNWLNGYEKAIKKVRLSNIVAPRLSNSSDAKTEYRHTIPMLMTSFWDQSSPYNDLCPDYNDGVGHRYTGCVATAMAQVMYYNKWPQECTKAIPGYIYTDETSLGGNGSKRKVEALPAITFQWDKMLDTYDKTSLPENNKAVAELMHYCGASVEMSYGVYASGAFSVDIANALRTYFGYDKGVRFLDREGIAAQDWEEIIYNEIAASRPVLYSGAAKVGGHQFVCDGYENGYFHFNWGWSGMSDGFFKLDALAPFAQGIGGAGDGMNFCDAQELVIGIQPPVENSVQEKGTPAVSWMLLSKDTHGNLTKTKGGMLKMSIKSRFGYHGEEDGNYTVGFGLCNADGELVKVIKEANKRFQAGVNTSVNEFNTPITLTKTDLENDGVYYIKPIYVSHKTNNYEFAPNSENVYFKLDVNGSDVHVTQYPYIDIDVKELTLKGELYSGVMLKLNASILNLGKAFDGNVELTIDGKPQSSISTKLFMLENELKDVSLEFTCPKTGEVRLGMVINGWKFTDEITVNIEKGETSASKLKIRTIKGYTSKANFFDIETEITNLSTENPYCSSVKAMLYKKIGGKYIFVADQTKAINLPVSESTRVSYHFDNLEFNTVYYLAFSYYLYSSEEFYGGKNKEGLPILYFDSFKTPDAFVYYDLNGNMTYEVLADTMDVTIPESAYYVRIPRVSDNVTIKKNSNANCIYAIPNYLSLPKPLEVFEGSNTTVYTRTANQAKEINLYDTDDIYNFENIDIAKLNVVITVDNQLESLWLPFNPESVTCDGVELGRAYTLDELTSGDKDFILLPCIAEDSETLYFDFDNNFIDSPCILNVNKRFIGKKLVFSISDTNVNKLNYNTISGSYFDLYRLDSTKNLNDNIYGFATNKFVKDAKFDKTFRFYAKSTSEAAPAMINVSLPTDFVQAGIDEITTAAEGKLVDVYTVEGVKVSTIVYGNDMLSSLPSGIYIINGKKYVK